MHTTIMAWHSLFGALTCLNQTNPDGLSSTSVDEHNQISQTVYLEFVFI